MMKRFKAILLIIHIAVLSAAAQTSVTSPDGRLTFLIKQNSSAPEYKVVYKNQDLVDWSAMRLLTIHDNIMEGLKISSSSVKDHVETYSLLVGKTSTVVHPYRELQVKFRSKTNQSNIDLIVRIFNDGVAFRYLYKKVRGQDLLELKDECTEFKLVGNPLIKALYLPNYTTSHEGPYTTAAFSNVNADTLADMPLLVEYPGKVYMAITEAALLDYAGMYLVKNQNGFVSRLSPLPNGNGLTVKAALPHQSPWRVMLIGDRMATLMESNILTTLCPPQKQGDWSWLKPGTSTFPWWNGNVLPDSINAPGNNFITQQYYIDFCARNNITYHSVVEYGLHQWYTDDGVNFQPGPNPDVTKPVPGLDMKQVCDYAHNKGVDIRVWVHWAALYPKLDSAFAQFERWGISGMMVDFMDRDDQDMVNIQTEILEKAAKHKLHIQFHGAYKPTGLSRTYPNEFTREGTMNYEVHKWDKKVTPSHDLDIVFTRSLAGPTDYHLGGFRAIPDSLFRIQYTRPLMLGTRAHSLAMYIVLEGALQMVCDFPEAYEGQAGFSFLQNLPTTWDAIKVISAVPDSHAAIARRKGEVWYVGAINGNTAKEMPVPMNFLGEGNYEVELFGDASDSQTNPDHLSIEKKIVTKSSMLSVRMVAGGGMAAIIKPAL